MEPEFRPDLVLAHLSAAGVEYVVIGGLAAQAHGSSPTGFPGYAAPSERALWVEWAGTPIKFASLEDLIAMKRAAGRPKDLLAVEELEAIQRLLGD